MQLSAPASASFPDAPVPASPGDVPADVLLDGEAPAADFGAVFAGLTRPASAPASTRTPPAPLTPGGQKSVSKNPMQAEDAAMMAAMAAFVVAPESVPPAQPAGSPRLAGAAWLGGGEGEAIAGSIEDESVSTQGDAVSMPALGGGPVPPAVGQGAVAPAAKQSGEAALASPAKLPVPPTPVSAAVPPAKVEAAARPQDPSPASAPVGAEAAELASPTVPSAIVRLATGAAVQIDPAARGLARSQSGRADLSNESPTKAAAKIAAAALVAGGKGEAAKMAGEINFLNVEQEQVGKVEAGVGTGVAIRESVMTHSAPASASPAIASVAVESRGPGFDLSAPPSLDAKVSVPEPIERLAHRAVEAVTETIERGASQTPTSVNLKFSVLGADLMVRVALRAEEIQVTFRTDSEDLRNALAQEWQLVRGRDADGMLQSVTPVFTAGDSGHSTAQQHSGGRDQASTFAHLQAQADAHSQRQFSRHAPSAPSVPAGGAPVVPGVTVSVARPLSSEASGAARLLHTFA